jgi:hypothetical protein
VSANAKSIRYSSNPIRDFCHLQPLSSRVPISTKSSAPCDAIHRRDWPSFAIALSAFVHECLLTLWVLTDLRGPAIRAPPAVRIRKAILGEFMHAAERADLAREPGIACGLRLTKAASAS